MGLRLSACTAYIAGVSFPNHDIMLRSWLGVAWVKLSRALPSRTKTWHGHKPSSTMEPRALLPRDGGDSAATVGYGV